MQGAASLLSVVTYPPGAGLGQRIVIDGVRGAIFEYDSSNNLVGSWASKAGTDPYLHGYNEGLNITVGSIIGPVIKGTDWIIDSSGFFFYSGPPALGNLLISLTSAGGKDTFGNPYVAGLQITVPGAGYVQFYNGLWTHYASAGVISGQIDLSGNAIAFYAGNGLGAYNLGMELQELIHTFYVPVQGNLALSPPDRVNAIQMADIYSLNETVANMPWNSMSARGYINGYTDNGLYPPGRYRMLSSPPNSVQIEGELNTGTSRTDGSSVVNLPLAYHVTTGIVIAELMVPGGIASGTWPRLYLAPSGNIQVFGIAALGPNVRLVIPPNSCYPLD